MIGSDLLELQQQLMKRVAVAAAANDVNAVVQLSAAAENLRTLTQRAEEIAAGVNHLRQMLDGNAPLKVQQNLAINKLPHALAGRRGKREGADARTRWIEQVKQSGVWLSGSGKSYETASGQAVGVAFANELPDHPNKWWLGLPEQSSGFAVLLCREKNGKTTDIVLPIAELGIRWKALSRSNGQIKFNVRRDGSDLVLLIPESKPFSIKRYVGAYAVLR